MIDFIAVFAVLIDGEISFVNLEMSGNKYPTPDDSVDICSYAKTVEPYDFIDIVAVIDTEGEVVWEDEESA